MRLSIVLIATLVAMMSVHMTSSSLTGVSLVKSATALALVSGVPAVSPSPFLGLLALKKLKFFLPLLGPKGLLLALKLPKLAKLKLLILKNGILNPFFPVKVMLIGAAMLATGASLAVAAIILLKKLKAGQEEEEEEEYTPYETEYNSYEPAPPATYGAPAYAPAPKPVTYAAPAPPASYNALPVSYGPVPQAPAPQFVSASPAVGDSFVGNPVDGTPGADRKRSVSLEDQLAVVLDESLPKTINKRHTFEDEDEEDDDDLTQLTPIERSEAADEYFYMAAEMDNKGCARRVICEVFHKPYSHLSLEEKIMRHMFGPTLTLPRADELDTARGMFRQAAYIGVTTSAIPSSCAQAYASCPYNSNAFFNSLHQSGIATNAL